MRSEKKEKGGKKTNQTLRPEGVFSSYPSLSVFIR